MAVATKTQTATERALRRLQAVLHDEREHPVSVPFSLLWQITKGFSQDEEIGQGGFAAVYKVRTTRLLASLICVVPEIWNYPIENVVVICMQGSLPKGQVVAVKKIDTSKTDAALLEDEIACMKRAKHKNVVRLLGYYRAKEPENVLILCSEYVPNGSLTRYLKGMCMCTCFDS